MCCPINSHNAQAWTCGGITLLMVAAITLLVVGILGATRAIHMSPTGADWMMAMGSAIIVGTIIGLLKVYCRNK